MPWLTASPKPSAERLHERVRREFWAYAPDEHLTGDDLILEKYRGVRPPPATPAAPTTPRNHAFRLARRGKRTPASPSPKAWHVPGFVGQRPLLRPPGRPLLRPGAASATTRWPILLSGKYARGGAGALVGAEPELRASRAGDGGFLGFPGLKALGYRAFPAAPVSQG